MNVVAENVRKRKGTSQFDGTGKSATTLLSTAHARGHMGLLPGRKIYLSTCLRGFKHGCCEFISPTNILFHRFLLLGCTFGLVQVSQDSHLVSHLLSAMRCLVSSITRVITSISSFTSHVTDLSKIEDLLDLAKGAEPPSLSPVSGLSCLDQLQLSLIHI